MVRREATGGSPLSCRQACGASCPTTPLPLASRAQPGCPNPASAAHCRPRCRPCAPSALLLLTPARKLCFQRTKPAHSSLQDRCFSEPRRPSLSRGTAGSRARGGHALPLTPLAPRQPTGPNRHPRSTAISSADPTWRSTLLTRLPGGLPAVRSASPRTGRSFSVPALPGQVTAQTWDPIWGHPKMTFSHLSKWRHHLPGAAAPHLQATYPPFPSSPHGTWRYLKTFPGPHPFPQASMVTIRCLPPSPGQRSQGLGWCPLPRLSMTLERGQLGPATPLSEPTKALLHRAEETAISPWAILRGLLPRPLPAFLSPAPHRSAATCLTSTPTPSPAQGLRGPW